MILPQTRQPQPQLPRKTILARRAGGLSSLLVLLGGIGWLGSGWAQAGIQTEPPDDLLGGKLTDVWAFFSAEKETKLEQSWTLDTTDEKDPVLKCTGKPYGYLKTKKPYEDFELTLEWKYPADENGNSGVLIYTNEPDKIWPRSIQVQFHTPTAGSILPNNGAKIGQQSMPAEIKLDVNTWHKCRVRSQGGVVTVFINDKQVHDANGCMPSKGAIGLQSEGSEIHFRRILVTPLKPKPEDVKDEAEKKAE